jgi:membrane glycosyltransferase
MSPTIVGLLLAIPLSWLSGQLAVGLALRRAGLLLTPEESSPPQVASRANDLVLHNAKLGFDDEDALLALHRNQVLREMHEAMLPTLPPRRRGDVETDRALAEARIADAETIQEAATWLKPKERFVLLHDKALLDSALRLRDEAAAPAQAAAE